jgi:hypothetical protein
VTSLRIKVLNEKGSPREQTLHTCKQTQSWLRSDEELNITASSRVVSIFVRFFLGKFVLTMKFFTSEDVSARCTRRKA